MRCTDSGGPGLRYRLCLSRSSRYFVFRSSMLFRPPDHRGRSRFCWQFYIRRCGEWRFRCSCRSRDDGLQYFYPAAGGRFTIVDPQNWWRCSRSWYVHYGHSSRRAFSAKRRKRTSGRREVSGLIIQSKPAWRRQCHPVINAIPDKKKKKNKIYCRKLEVRRDLFLPQKEKFYSSGFWGGSPG